MRFGTLRAIGHNIADSVGCGMGFMVGVSQMDVFGEAAGTPEGFIEVDFLTGATSGGRPSPSLARGLQLYSERALPELCERHGGTVSDFKTLKVRFRQGPRQAYFEVTVEDKKGRSASDEYEAPTGKRVKSLTRVKRIAPDPAEEASG